MHWRCHFMELMALPAYHEGLLEELWIHCKLYWQVSSTALPLTGAVRSFSLHAVFLFRYAAPYTLRHRSRGWLNACSFAAYRFLTRLLLRRRKQPYVRGISHCLRTLPSTGAEGVFW
jgi:hypothetical protein